MKATGIVRRIDDLGRIVIPKEIRRTLRLREGTPLEIFTDRNGEVIFKKYSPMAELGSFAKQYADSLAQTSGHMVCITDRDQIIAISGGMKKDFLGKSISKAMESLIQNRDVVITKKNERCKISVSNEDAKIYTGQVIYPIICEGDAIGSVGLFGKDTKNIMGETEQKLTAAAAGFLGRQMEN
jgi:AbrB family transcriptional regulator (stage V sporulation protein T)